jgi:hypothetical protein
VDDSVLAWVKSVHPSLAKHARRGHPALLARSLLKHLTRGARSIASTQHIKEIQHGVQSARRPPPPVPELRGKAQAASLEQFLTQPIGRPLQLSESQLQAFKRLADTSASSLRPSARLHAAPAEESG